MLSDAFLPVASLRFIFQSKFRLSGFLSAPFDQVPPPVLEICVLFRLTRLSLAVYIFGKLENWKMGHSGRLRHLGCAFGCIKL